MIIVGRVWILCVVLLLFLSACEVTVAETPSNTVEEEMQDDGLPTEDELPPEEDDLVSDPNLETTAPILNALEFEDNIDCDDFNMSKNVTPTDGTDYIMAVLDDNLSSHYEHVYVSMNKCYQITLEGLPKDSYAPKIEFIAESWSTSDPTIAEIDPEGYLKFHKPGTVSFSVTTLNTTVSSSTTVFHGIPEEVLIPLCLDTIGDPSDMYRYPCLKAIQTSDGDLYSPNAHTALAKAMGMVRNNGDVDVGHTLSYTTSVKAGASKHFDNVTLMSQLTFEEGGRTQWERWCDALNLAEFAGKTNWSVLSDTDILAFLDKVGHMSNQGWDVYLSYLTTHIYPKGNFMMVDTYYLGQSDIGKIFEQTSGAGAFANYMCHAKNEG